MVYNYFCNLIDIMMKQLILLVLLFSVSNSYGQDPAVKDLQEAVGKKIKKDPNDTTVKTWKKGGVYSLNTPRVR